MKLRASKGSARRKLRRVNGHGLPDFAKLAWMSQRTGRAGSDALQVLQDALEMFYATPLKAAIIRAKGRLKRTGSSGRVYPTAILFAPSMERAVREHLQPDTQRFYAKHHWPFLVTNNPNLSRPTAVVIWDTVADRDVHHWVELRKRGVSPR